MQDSLELFFQDGNTANMETFIREILSKGDDPNMIEFVCSLSKGIKYYSIEYDWRVRDPKMTAFLSFLNAIAEKAGVTSSTPSQSNPSNAVAHINPLPTTATTSTATPSSSAI